VITASALPRLFACPGSSALPHANTTSDDAEAGTKRHEIREAQLKSEGLSSLPRRVLDLIPGASLAAAEVACAYDVAAGKVRQLGVGIQRDYGGIAPTEIAGTLDLIVASSTAVLALDWKGHARLGRPSHHEQVMFAGLCASQLFPGRAVIVAIGYADDWIDHDHVDDLDLDAFAVRLPALLEAVAAQRSRKIPDVAEGGHCQHCPAMHACPAKVALMRRLTSGAEADDLELMMPLDDNTARVAYERLKAARHLLARVERAIYARAAEHPIPLGNGKVLGKRTVRGNEKLDGDIAYEVLRDQRGQSCADMAVRRTATKKAIGEALRWSLVGNETQRSAEETTLREIRARGGATREESERIEEYVLELEAGK